MKSSNVVPALLLSPVFSSYVVPALLPWRQQIAGVVAEIGGSAAAPGLRSCRAALPAAPSAQGCGSLAWARCWGAVPAHAYQVCTLRFYWNIDGSSSWQSASVDSVGCVSTPAITRSNSATEVAAELPDGSLRFYWNNDGSPTWHPVQVAGPGSVSGIPAITDFAGQTDVAITAPGGSVWFYWVTDGTPTWHSTQASGSAAITGSPAIVSGFAFPFVVTFIQATGSDGSLWNFASSSSSGTTWQSQDIAGAGAASGIPANNGTDTAAAGPGGSLWFYWYNSNSFVPWSSEQVAGYGAVSGSPAMVMIRSSNATEIIAAGQ